MTTMPSPNHIFSINKSSELDQITPDVAGAVWRQSDPGLDSELDSLLSKENDIGENMNVKMSNGYSNLNMNETKTIENNNLINEETLLSEIKNKDQAGDVNEEITKENDTEKSVILTIFEQLVAFKESKSSNTLEHSHTKNIPKDNIIAEKNNEEESLTKETDFFDFEETVIFRLKPYSSNTNLISKIEDIKCLDEKNGLERENIAIDSLNIFEMKNDLKDDYKTNSSEEKELLNLNIISNLIVRNVEFISTYENNNETTDNKIIRNNENQISELFADNKENILVINHLEPHLINGDDTRRCVKKTKSYNNNDINNSMNKYFTNEREDMDDKTNLQINKLVNENSTEKLETNLRSDSQLEKINSIRTKPVNECHFCDTSVLHNRHDGDFVHPKQTILTAIGYDNVFEEGQIKGLSGDNISRVYGVGENKQNDERAERFLDFAVCEAQDLTEDLKKLHHLLEGL